ncbi:Protein FAR1-RELATED SEQUENCE 11 [Bienertia sinuspersici]
MVKGLKSFNHSLHLHHSRHKIISHQPVRQPLWTSTKLRPVGDVSATAAAQEMGIKRSTNEEIDVNSDAVDEVVCLSDDGNPTTPMQADGSETTAAVETRGTPKKGMTFDSMEALEKFYSSYGKACGFGVIRVGAKKDRNTNVKRWQYWHCECGPGMSSNKVGKEGDPKWAEVQPCKRRRKSKKCGWEAGIAGYLNKDGLWEIHKVELTHKNHVPTPSKSRFIPSYRDVPEFVLRVAKDLMDAGMSTTKRVESIHHFFKGFMNAKTSLREFVQKYTRAIECRANAEKVATANDDRRKTRIKSTLMVERFFPKNLYRC